MNYRPTLLIKVTLVLHGLLLLAVLIWPGQWLKLLIILLANHLLLTALGLWPRSRALGENITRLPSNAGPVVALTIDDGPDPEVTPKVLDMLDELQMKASFFVIGRRVSSHPDLTREIVRRGHEVHNHSDTHSYAFSCFMPRALRREIVQGQAAIEAATGQCSHLFRAPAGLRNPLLDFVLQGLNIRLVAWSKRGFDTVNGDADKVSTALINNLSAGDILLLHDGRAALDQQAQPVILAVLPRLAQALKQKQLATVTLSACLN